MVTPLGMDRLLYEWDSSLAARDIAQLHETTHWNSQLSPPPVGVASLYPHYASLKTIMGREEHLKHPPCTSGGCGCVTSAYWTWQVEDLYRGARESPA